MMLAGWVRLQKSAGLLIVVVAQSQNIRLSCRGEVFPGGGAREGEGDVWEIFWIQLKCDFGEDRA